MLHVVRDKKLLNLYMFDFQKGNDCILVFEEKLQYSYLALNIFLINVLLVSFRKKEFKKKEFGAKENSLKYIHVYTYVCGYDNFECSH